MGALTHNGEVLQSLPANASQINFDKTGTNLNSTQVENAIKEVNTKVNTNTDDITQLKSGLTNIGSSTDLGNVQGSDTITLSNAVTNYRFVQILIGYYASGYPCYGQALLPVSTLFIGSDDISITVPFADRTGHTSGNAEISFLSATSAKVVNTNDSVYTKFIGIA